LRPGEQLEIQTLDGSKWRFRIDETHVIDSRTDRLQFDDGAATITLLTCYPFNAIAPGGPLRYVAVASLQPQQPTR
jgi:sortase A